MAMGVLTSLPNAPPHNKPIVFVYEQLLLTLPRPPRPGAAPRRPVPRFSPYTRHLDTVHAAIHATTLVNEIHRPCSGTTAVQKWTLRRSVNMVPHG